MSFKPAKNYERFLRMALVGTPKTGKTWTSLLLAFALAGENGRVGVIDTENASSSKYQPHFPPFSVSELESFDPDTYCQEIEEAERSGLDVLIIDSLTHAWNGPGGLLQVKHQIASSGKPGMNEYTAWAEATPKQDRLIHAITHAPMHVIATMRSKMEYAYEPKASGTGFKVTRLSLAPIQREETEYEFDILASLDRSHTMTIEGSRCPALDQMEIARPDGSIVEIIKAWLAGEKVPEPSPQLLEMRALLQAFYDLSPFTYARIRGWQQLALHKGLDIPPTSILPLPQDYTDEHVEKMRAYVTQRQAEKEAKEASIR